MLIIRKPLLCSYSDSDMYFMELRCLFNILNKMVSSFLISFSKSDCLCNLFAKINSFQSLPGQSLNLKVDSTVNQ